MVVKLGESFGRKLIDGMKVTVGAAAQFGSMVETVVDRGLAGLEFGEGIPGTVGGGLVMNAGAFGGEMARVVTLVHGVTIDGLSSRVDEGRSEFRLPAHRLAAALRDHAGRFRYSRHGDREALRARVMDLRSKRASRQPRGLPNAGSVFKNPPEILRVACSKAWASRAREWAVRRSPEQHANFIVNLGGARADEVRALDRVGA